MRAPFPYFGGKRTVIDLVWARLGQPKQYIEPFCGSAAILLGAKEPAPLEVVGDLNGFIANFWRAVVHQSDEVARWADYPVSHIDQGARHRWLMGQRDRLGAELQDPDWPGDAKVAGWWLWGQCSWIGSGWCEWAAGKVPHVSDAGRGVVWTSSGATAYRWLRELAARMERVRVVHGAWDRCLNHHYGANETAIFFDPPYLAFERLYGTGGEPVASQVADWCREHPHLRIALCGHRGDYRLGGWTEVGWERERLTYGSDKTKAEECIWFSPACHVPEVLGQRELFAAI